MTHPIPQLSEREREVVALLALGWPNKRIAAHLRKQDGSSMAIRTVEAHIEHVAALLPNPEKLPARTLVMLWAIHQAA